jgi:hypothetical protein
MEHPCRTVNLGDSRLRIRTEMNTTHKHNDVGAPEMTAKAWDDYLQRFGAGRTSRRGTVLPSAKRHSVRVRIVWTGLPQIHRDPFGASGQAA